MENVVAHIPWRTGVQPNVIPIQSTGAVLNLAFADRPKNIATAMLASTIDPCLWGLVVQFVRIDDVAQISPWTMEVRPGATATAPITAVPFTAIAARVPTTVTALVASIIARLSHNLSPW